MEAHPGTASWFQAIGSVAAIFAGVALAWLTIREQRLQTWRRERQFLTETILVVRWMILDGKQWLAALADGAQTTADWIATYAPAEHMVRSIESLAERAATECPDPKAAGGIRNLPTYYREMISRAQGVAGGTVALENHHFEGRLVLGALERADIYCAALAQIQGSAEAALKTLR
jgi:hypothetical protein